MIFCSGLELKKRHIAVSKHLGILLNIRRGDNNARTSVKTASSAAVIVCLVGVSVNCDVIVYMCGMACSVVVLWWTILLTQFY